MDGGVDTMLLFKGVNLKGFFPVLASVLASLPVCCYDGG
jgi:hypothetical protein